MVFNDRFNFIYNYDVIMFVFEDFDEIIVF